MVTKSKKTKSIKEIATAKAKKKSKPPANLRESIIEEAIKIIAESGVESLSLRDIARRLGVSHSAPNRHFATKEDLLAGVASKGFQIFAESLKEGLEEADTLETAVAGFTTMRNNYLKFTVDYPDLFKFIFGAAVPKDPKYEDLQYWSMEAFEILIRQLTRLREFGVLNSGNLFVCAMFCTMTMQGFAVQRINQMQHHLSGRYNFKGELQDYIDTFVLGGMNAILSKK